MLILLTLFALPGCVPTQNTIPPTTNLPLASASPTPLSSPAPTASPANTGSTNTPGSSTTQPTPTASSTPGTGTTNNINISQISRLELDAAQRFLSASGQSAKVTVRFIDANGNLLSLNNVPVSYTVSRPTDFRVSEDGTVTALVNEGFSDIIVTLPGSNLSAKQLFSVSSPSGGSSGGGGGSSSGNTNTQPTQENVNGQIEFQF